MKIKPIIILAAGLLLSGGVHAYCVYNDTDKPVQFSGVGFNMFKAYLDPKPNGKESPKSCCHWQNASCNSNGKQDALVQMALSVKTDGGKYYNLHCGNAFQIRSKQAPRPGPGRWRRSAHAGWRVC